MEIIQNVWLALNIVFGLWSARNWVIFTYCVLFGGRVRQSQLGKVLDLVVPASILAYYFTYYP